MLARRPARPGAAPATGPRRRGRPPRHSEKPRTGTVATTRVRRQVGGPPGRELGRQPLDQPGVGARAGRSSQDQERRRGGEQGAGHLGVKPLVTTTTRRTPNTALKPAPRTLAVPRRASFSSCPRCSSRRRGGQPSSGGSGHAASLGAAPAPAQRRSRRPGRRSPGDPPRSAGGRCGPTTSAASGGSRACAQLRDLLHGARAGRAPGSPRRGPGRTRRRAPRPRRESMPATGGRPGGRRRSAA